MPSSDILLIGRKSCPYVHRVLLYVWYKALDIDYICLEDSDEIDIQQISPTGKVPVLIVGDKVIFESNVILEYFDRAHLSPLLPPCLTDRARTVSWMSFADYLHGKQAKLFDSEKSDWQPCFENYEKALSILDQNIDGFPSIESGSVTMLDIVYAPLLYRLFLVEQNFNVALLEKTPNLRKWSERLTAWVISSGVIGADFEERYIAHLVEWPCHLADMSAY